MNIFVYVLTFQNVCSLDLSYENSEQWTPVCSIVKRSVHRMYTDRKQIMMNRLPILKWVPTYRLSYLFYDFIAGLTVGLTAIPQGIAYAIVAGLPAQYGLYSGFVGSFVYLIFGSSKDVTIGKSSRSFNRRFSNQHLFVLFQVRLQYYHCSYSVMWPKIWILQYFWRSSMGQ